MFTDIALSLGKETFYKYLAAFGYGSTSGVDFIGEQSGLIVPQSTVTRGDLARIGFGQTIAVTPFAVVLRNGGGGKRRIAYATVSCQGNCRRHYG